MTHEPIAGGVVSVDGTVVALTDEAGRFVLAARCPGTLLIRIERPDYQAGETTLRLADHVSFELALEPGGEVIVIEETAPTPIDLRSTAAITGAALERTRGKSLSEAVATVPGVALLRSGSGMSKPIVRGQFGRRLLLLVDGVRHRAQEWGLDHAPEVDPFVADKLTVVRGAAGVRYGPDAIGGAILVEPPAPKPEPGAAGEVHLIGFARGLGASLGARLSETLAAPRGLSWSAEGTVRRAASPSTPDYALDNTGVDEWNLGGSLGYRAGDDEYALSYIHYQARLGVCTCLQIDSLEDFYAQLERERPLGADAYRADLAIDRPSQEVEHELAIARATWRRPALGKLSATYALQFDHRREYDVARQATTGPQFEFLLTTHDLQVVAEHNPIHLNQHLHLRGEVGVAGMTQVHWYGGLPLVPDHTGWSAGVFASERLIGDVFEVEAGLRYDRLAREASIERDDFRRLVRSDQLAADACGASGADPVTCASVFHTVSASLGGLRQLTRLWSIKAEVSTASRPPNTDEQYLNGTAPTFPVVGLGKPDLGAETTYAGSVTTRYQGERIAAEVSGFGSYIDDYIYFAPAVDAAGAPIFDTLIRGTFPRFVTRPVDAVFYGADGGVALKPTPALAVDAQVSMVRARNRSDDSYLVFVPPDRARGAVTYTTSVGWVRSAFATVAGTYVARQDRFDPKADLAPPPDGYFLLDAGVGAEARVGTDTFKLALEGTNLLNARYRDYTSLLRYFADQPGYQVLLRLSVQFDSSGRP